MTGDNFPNLDHRACEYGREIEDPAAPIRGLFFGLLFSMIFWVSLAVITIIVIWGA